MSCEDRILEQGDALRAAGAVLWRAGPDGVPRVAVIHRPKQDDWTFPKGKPEPGEHPLVTAVREVEEETGHRVRLGPALPTVRYLTGEGRPKTVRFWAGADSGGEFTPNREVDELRWLPPAQARELLSYPSDHRVLDAFTTMEQDTQALVVLRHAEALDRADWAGPDAARPLSAAGYQQAERLADLLAAYGPKLLISSDARRCVDTLRPYAERYGIEIVTDHALSEEAYLADPTGLHAALDRALDRALDTALNNRASDRAAGTRKPLVVCSHRPVLPVLATLLRARLAGMREQVLRTPLAPGAFWVFHLVDSRITGVERYSS
ncbi:NUDIX hydrolase [Carbonactinospora thermoautotrophica]|uniref:NUDIX hydrolase n=1 Tax=Carbonactinospora thermoautotrophica TaxID=1469144 RepID=UPI0027E1CAF7|nr:NUDIX hydrolase [Carbonactinospora thermoautotrophica]MCX9193261.1 NUDIX hydrolase [Carbonactinospora thermoautotrophica]